MAQAQGTGASGIQGVITFAPIHGGPSRIGEPDSAPLANTTFVVENGSGGSVSSFTTDIQGRFHISLAPGHYTVRRKDYDAKVGFYGPFPVEVVAGKVTNVSWACDTGHR